MRTCLFSTIYLNGLDPTGSARYDRTVKWLKYHLQPAVMEALGYSRILLTDNSSDIELTQRLVNDVPMSYVQGYDNLAEVDYEITDYTIACLRLPYLGKEDNGCKHDYPYVWRGFHSMNELTLRYDKIYRIDNDCYVLTEKFANYLRAAQSGWLCANQAKHTDGYPEDAVSVIHKDAYHLLRTMCDKTPLQMNRRWLERTVPWTEVLMQFNGDRYGVGKKRIQQDDSMDYYSQCPVDVPMTFRRF